MCFDILFVVSSSDSAAYLQPLLEAADRAACKVAVFLTNDGARLAASQELGEVLAARDSVVVCADSWSRYMADANCPICLGSQTDHSQLAAEANKMISL